jgi:hypothetical protein
VFPQVSRAGTGPSRFSSFTWQAGDEVSRLGTEVFCDSPARFLREQEGISPRRRGALRRQRDPTRARRSHPARWHALLRHVELALRGNRPLEIRRGLRRHHRQIPRHRRLRENAPDFTTLQAIITASVSGSTVKIGWGWSGFSAFLDLIELIVDRNDGKGFVPLAYDTTPGYEDSTPFPATPPSGPTRPSTAWTTTKSANGATR